MKTEPERPPATTSSNGRSRARRPSTPRPPREALVLAAIGIPVLVVAALAAVLIGGQPGGAAATTSPATVVSGAPSGNQANPLVHPDSPALGPVDARVTLVEFLDPECESCRAAYPMVKSVLADYDGDVRLVVRYVAGHNNSALAVVALEEAGRQGRYWETLEYFFDRQPEWGERQEPQTEAFLRYGEELGLDVEKLRAALASPDFTKVERDLRDAQALGIQGTPTFFVNSRLVEDLSEEGLRRAIEDAL